MYQLGVFYGRPKTFRARAIVRADGEDGHSVGRGGKRVRVRMTALQKIRWWWPRSAPWSTAHSGSPHSVYCTAKTQQAFVYNEKAAPAMSEGVMRTLPPEKKAP